MVLARFVQTRGATGTGLAGVGLAVSGFAMAAAGLAFAATGPGHASGAATRTARIEARVQTVAISIFGAAMLMAMQGLAISGLIYTVEMTLVALFGIGLGAGRRGPGAGGGARLNPEGQGMGGMVGRLIGEGFRVFFLMAGLVALAAIGWWELDLALGLAAPFAMAPAEWHAHELVFGYGGAVLGGFLAAMRGPGQRWLTALAAGLWLAGRAALFASASLPPLAVALIDLGFVPLLWLRLALPFLSRPKPQNALLIVFLGLFWAANLATHLGWAGLWRGGETIGPRAGLVTLAGLILAVGGRLTPGFTRNAMHRAGVPDARLPREIGWLGPVVVALAAATALAFLAAPDSGIAAGLALGAGGVQLVRQSRWGARFALGQPILWAMHLAAALVALGLCALGLSHVTAVSEVAALHLAGIGGIGAMTLAVMTRQSLGLTGRACVAPRPAVAAFVLIAVAALVRFVGASLGGAICLAATLTAGAAWIAGFGLWLLCLAPVLLGPRLGRSPPQA